MNVATHTDALSQWAPQRRLSLAQARKRSELVGVLRIAFVVAAAVSAGIMVGPIMASSLGSGTNGPVRLAADEVVTMVNPRFTGRNVAGEAFVITAETARRRLADSNIIDLTNPHLINETGTEVTAPTGIYNQNAEYLDLFEEVQVSDGQGYFFNTTAARIFVQDGRIEGLQPLSGNGPLGDVRSDSYEIIDDGDRVILRGNVNMTIYPNAREDDTAPEDSENTAPIVEEQIVEEE